MGTDTKLTTLYRPVGTLERQLIADTGWRRFPPRLPHQPIFYPVLNEEYATMIARDWNTKDEASGFTGYVLRFEVRTAFLAPYNVHTVGGRVCQEYWIPAEELERFNDAIEGQIVEVASYQSRAD